MMTVSFTVSDELYAAFQRKFPAEAQAAQALKSAFFELVQDDPYSPEAYAEDERRYQEMVDGGPFLTTEEVIEKLRKQLAQHGR